MPTYVHYSLMEKQGSWWNPEPNYFVKNPPKDPLDALDPKIESVSKSIMQGAGNAWNALGGERAKNWLAGALPSGTSAPGVPGGMGVVASNNAPLGASPAPVTPAVAPKPAAPAADAFAKPGYDAFSDAAMTKNWFQRSMKPGAFAHLPASVTPNYENIFDQQVGKLSDQPTSRPAVSSPSPSAAAKSSQRPFPGIRPTGSKTAADQDLLNQWFNYYHHTNFERTSRMDRGKMEQLKQKFGIK